MVSQQRNKFPNHQSKSIGKLIQAFMLIWQTQQNIVFFFSCFFFKKRANIWGKTKAKVVFLERWSVRKTEYTNRPTNKTEPMLRTQILGQKPTDDIQAHIFAFKINTSKWVIHPSSSSIAWSMTSLMLRKREFNAFAETGSPDLPIDIRSMIVWICGLHKPSDVLKENNENTKQKAKAKLQP